MAVGPILKKRTPAAPGRIGRGVSITYRQGGKERQPSGSGLLDLVRGWEQETGGRGSSRTTQVFQAIESIRCRIETAVGEWDRWWRKRATEDPAQ